MSDDVLDDRLLTSGTPINEGEDASHPDATQRPVKDTDAENAPEGELLALAKDDPKECCRRIVALWTAQDEAAKRRNIFWQRNRMWEKGYVGVNVRPVSSDLMQYVLDIPFGLADMRPVMGRIQLLGERLCSWLLTDEPKPECEAMKDQEEDTDGAEFGDRILEVDGATSGTNDDLVFRRAVKKSYVFGSAFAYVYVDPQGGGWQPMEVQAHPDAETADDATVDPATGEEATDAHGEPDESQLVKKYEAPDGSLTDDPNEAKRQWLPSLCVDLLTGHQVRPLPEISSDIAKCDGVMVLSVTTMGKLREAYPELFKTLSSEDQQSLIKWQPEAARWALPWYAKFAAMSTRPSKADGSPHDDSPVVQLALYYKSSGMYPDGAYILIAGGSDGEVLYADSWTGDTQLVDGQEMRRPLELPVAQCKQLNDDDSDDFYGDGLVAQLGPIDEIRKTIVTAYVEHMDRYLHPITFLPIGSIVQPEAIAARTGEPVYTNPDGAPMVEEVPPFLPDAVAFLDRATVAENDIVGFSDAGDVDSRHAPDSGIAKQIDKERSTQNLTTIKKNLADFIKRYWRIKLQLMRANYTIPQKTAIVGDDGQYKVTEWTRTDLLTITDVAIRQGTFTQLTPDAKEQKAMALLQMGRIDGYEFDRMTAGNISQMLGARDNPHRMRVRRQLAEWRHGPTPQWEQSYQQYTAAQQQLQQAQAMAQQVATNATQGNPQAAQLIPQLVQRYMATNIPAQMAQRVPPPTTPFQILPCDQEQDVAVLRHGELRRVIASGTFKKFGSQDPSQPSPWQSVLLTAYAQAKQAAGIMTVAEQQQAQQAQLAQQAQAEASAKSAPAQISAQARAASTATQQQGESARETIKQQGETQRTALVIAGDHSLAADTTAQEVAKISALEQAKFEKEIALQQAGAALGTSGASASNGPMSAAAPG